jgi:hypothetical protein
MFFEGMSNVTQIIRPFFDQYIDPSMVEESIIAGAQFSVIPRKGQVSQLFYRISFCCLKFC